MTPDELKQLCIDLEHFETPRWAADAILWKEILTPVVVDPCAGTGVLCKAAAEAGYTSPSAIDINDWGYPLLRKANFLHLPKAEIMWGRLPFSILMNPPFSLAQEFVLHSIKLGATKIVCFQRFAWWESEKRRTFWKENPPNRVYICGNRADCWRHDIPVEKRTSSTPTAHAWFVWEKGHPPGTLLGHIYRADTNPDLPL